MNIIFRKEAKFIYHSIHSLPLQVWIDIYTSGNINLLVKTGQFDEKVINDTWYNILEEYQSIYKDQNSEAQNSLVKRVAILNHRLQHLDSCIAMMRLFGEIIIWNEPIQIEFERTRMHLKSLGYDYQFMNIKGDTAKVEMRKQKMVIELRIMEKQLLDLIGNTHNKEKPTAYDFDEQISELAKFQAHRIDKLKTTVSEYMAILNRYKAYVKLQKEALNGK